MSAGAGDAEGYAEVYRGPPRLGLSAITAFVVSRDPPELLARPDIDCR